MAPPLHPVISLASIFQPNSQPRAHVVLLRKGEITDALSYTHVLTQVDVGGQLGLDFKCLSNCGSWPKCLSATILSNTNVTCNMNIRNLHLIHFLLSKRLKISIPHFLHLSK